MSQDFKNGKIYKITNDYNDDVYIGSTCDLLTKRFSKHKNDSTNNIKKNRPFYKLINEIGFERFRIELIEDYPCEDKYQLRQKEGHFIRELGTLNKRIEGRTKQEYQEDNKEKIQEWREDNKEKIQEHKKEYNKANKDKIQQYYKDKITCSVCGSIVCKRALSRHIKTSKHQSQMPENYEN